MRERLREVAQMATGAGVELFGVEAERRGLAEQPLEQVTCPLELADHRERRDEPERADDERPLLAGQPVVGLVGAVAQHEPILRELVGDGVHGRAQALVVAREEVEYRRKQRRGAERVGRVVLAKAAATVHAVLEDVGLYRLCGRGPLLLAARGAADL